MGSKLRKKLIAISILSWIGMTFPLPTLAGGHAKSMFDIELPRFSQVSPFPLSKAGSARSDLSSIELAHLSNRVLLELLKTTDWISRFRLAARSQNVKSLLLTHVGEIITDRGKRNRLVDHPVLGLSWEISGLDFLRYRFGDWISLMPRGTSPEGLKYIVGFPHGVDTEMTWWEATQTCNQLNSSLTRPSKLRAHLNAIANSTPYMDGYDLASNDVYTRLVGHGLLNYDQSRPLLYGLKMRSPEFWSSEWDTGFSYDTNKLRINEEGAYEFIGQFNPPSHAWAHRKEDDDSLFDNANTIETHLKRPFLCEIYLEE